MKSVIFNDQAIWGIGDDLDTAILEANDWLDKEITEDNVEKIFNEPMEEGQIYSAKITEALCEHVLQESGAIAFKHKNGILMTDYEYNNF